MRAEDVIELYTLFLHHGVQIWIDGGWGIDALLERQTRPHKDLDAFVASTDLPTLTTLLSRRGFVLKEIWRENQWLRYEGHVSLIGTGESAGEVATAFVLKDALGREIDIHVLHIGEHGSPTPAWNCTMSFSPDALTGHGSIAGSPVHCLSAAMHMRTHTGYQLQDKDVQDLRRLHERFGIDYPEELAHLRANSPKQGGRSIGQIHVVEVRGISDVWTLTRNRNRGRRVGEELCSIWRPNQRVQPTPLAASKMVAILKADFVSIAIPIYRGGAADTQAVGRLVLAMHSMCCAWLTE